MSSTRDLSFLGQRGVCLERHRTTIISLESTAFFFFYEFAFVYLVLGELETFPPRLLKLCYRKPVLPLLAISTLYRLGGTSRRIYSVQFEFTGTCCGKKYRDVVSTCVVDILHCRTGDVIPAPVSKFNFTAYTFRNDL